MHFSFCKFGGREHSIGVRGEEGGFERPNCWLEEETDPGEALTPSVFSFLLL